jgi:paraquat-inducible protein A
MTDAASPDATGGPFTVCPACDTVQREPSLEPGLSARCRRCGRVLFASRAGAINQIVSVAATSVVLMGCAIFLPFLEIETRGLTQKASLLDTVLAYGSGIMAPLVFALAALIVVLPTLRLLLLILALGPLVIRRPPLRRAGTAFRLAEAIRPWAMAEVFLVSAAVALVKVGDLARVDLGPAFWAIVALVLLNLMNDRLISSFTVWKSLEARRVP